jgi:hypothetical protein
MGGYGSGPRWANKETTTCYRQLDARRCQRRGLLVPGQVFGGDWIRDGELVASIGVRTEQGRLLVSYRHRANGQSPWRVEQYPILLAWTRCNYGGSRPWFICPCCGRRVAILYDGDILACRHCYQLAYNSQRNSVSERALVRTQTIRIKLGGSANLIEPFPLKPEKMHWRTYQRLRAEAEGCEAVFFSDSMRKIQR